MFLAYVFLSGCTGNTSPESIPTSPVDIMMKTVAATGWFTTFCLLSFFGAVIAISLGQTKIGGAVIVASIATVTFGLAIQRFPTWLAIIGFTGSVIGAGYSILIKNRALVEIVKGVERVKEEYDMYVSEGRIAEEFDSEQKHTSTKKIVRQVKAKLNGTNKQ